MAAEVAAAVLQSACGRLFTVRGPLIVRCYLRGGGAPGGTLWRGGALWSSCTALSSRRWGSKGWFSTPACCPAAARRPCMRAKTFAREAG